MLKYTTVLTTKDDQGIITAKGLLHSIKRTLASLACPLIHELQFLQVKNCNSWIIEQTNMIFAVFTRTYYLFQVVDMRWGVRDEATDDHMTTMLCMQEIDNCQRLSIGPNFVVSLSFQSTFSASDKKGQQR